MSKSNLIKPEHNEIAQVCKALSHPVRVYFVKKLMNIKGCCTSGEMFKELPIARSTLSRHLKELKYAGIIQGNIEPPFIKYCINRKNLEKIKKNFEVFFKIS